EQTPDFLPLTFTHDLAPRLTVVVHHSQNTPLAYAVPWAGLAQARGEPLTTDAAHEKTPFGTIFLHASYLDAEGRLRPFQDLPVDAAEQL
ncbi:hypothetical protein DF186_16990, partial [Enterococcus hirae]